MLRDKSLIVGLGQVAPYLIRLAPSATVNGIRVNVEGGAFRINQNYVLEVFMSKAKNGDTVKIHYMGKLEDGKVFDNSKERQPFEFIVGSGEVMPGIEKGVIGMEPGDTKTIEIPPQEAFGQRREELVIEIAKSELPDHTTPTKGQRLRMRQPDGGHIDLIIIDVNEERITLDANHPLAGHTLFFDLELVEIA